MLLINIGNEANMERRKTDKIIQPELLSHDDPILVNNYAEIVSCFPQAQIIRNDDGIVRFRENKLMRFFCDAGKGEMVSFDPYKEAPAEFSGAPTLNDIVKKYYNGSFSMEELMLFYQDIGYSLSGYLDIFGEEIDLMFKEGRQLLPGCRVVYSNTETNK